MPMRPTRFTAGSDESRAGRRGRRPRNRIHASSSGGLSCTSAGTRCITASSSTIASSGSLRWSSIRRSSACSSSTLSGAGRQLRHQRGGLARGARRRRDGRARGTRRRRSRPRAPRRRRTGPVLAAASDQQRRGDDPAARTPHGTGAPRNGSPAASTEQVTSITSCVTTDVTPTFMLGSPATSSLVIVRSALGPSTGRSYSMQTCRLPWSRFHRPHRRRGRPCW